MDISEIIQGQDSSIILSLIERMRIFIEHDKTLVLDPGKLFLVAKICKQICYLLNEQKCEYTIETYQDPIFKKRVWIQIDTWSFDVLPETMPAFQEILGEISALSFHPAEDGKMRITMYINDVYVESR